MLCQKNNTFYTLYYLKQVTPAQIREAEKSLKIMEGMIEAMTPGVFPLTVSFFDYLLYLLWMLKAFLQLTLVILVYVLIIFFFFLL